MKLDVARVSDIIRAVGQEEILPRFRNLASAEITEKAPGELVTVADKAAEVALSRGLRDLLPGSLVVGEEAAAADSGVFAHFEKNQPVWTVDPIDGTTNFTRGIEVFAVMVGLVRDNRTLAGWIYDPVKDEMTTAEKGGGAWRRDRRGRERRLSVAESRPPEEMRGTLHSSTYAAKALARRVQSRQNRVQRVKSLRCAGWEYLRLASGEMHFSLFTRLMPWDHIPGSLIQREAGGLCQLLTGAPYRATDDREQGILMAPDAEAWQALAAALLQDDPKP
jgi:fructose-1,6-bisphosphatase/inositol monophosphatase family enzyme